LPSTKYRLSHLYTSFFTNCTQAQTGVKSALTDFVSSRCQPTVHACTHARTHTHAHTGTHTTQPPLQHTLAKSVCRLCFTPALCKHTSTEMESCLQSIMCWVLTCSRAIIRHMTECKQEAL
jgi:hypothetical protein